MFRAAVNIRTKGAYEIRLSDDSFRKRRRGEILHLALSFLNSKKEAQKLEIYVKRAIVLLGEKYSSWDIETELVRPLKEVLKLEEAELFFSQRAREVFKERSILLPYRKYPERRVFRPDRMVLYEDRVVVVDFKSEKPSSAKIHDEYRDQVRNYAHLAQELFDLPAEGYLLFIAEPEVEKVCGS